MSKYFVFTIKTAYFATSHPTTPLEGGWGGKLLFCGENPLSVRGNKKKKYTRARLLLFLSPGFPPLLLLFPPFFYLSFPSSHFFFPSSIFFFLLLLPSFFCSFFLPFTSFLFPSSLSPGVVLPEIVHDSAVVQRKAVHKHPATHVANMASYSCGCSAKNE